MPTYDPNTTARISECQVNLPTIKPNTWIRRIVSLEDKQTKKRITLLQPEQEKKAREDDGIVCTTQNGTVKLGEGEGYSALRSGGLYPVVNG